MRTTFPSRIFSTVLVLFILAITASGCKPTLTPTPEPTLPPATATLPPPTATPTPERMVFVDPAGSAPAEITSYLADFAATNGLVYQGMTTLDNTDGARIVVFNNVPEGLSDLAAGTPQTQFVVIGAAEQGGLPNLSVVKSKPEDLAFMAGYLTMLIAWDWRAGGLIPSDTSLGASYADAFENGGRYLCGNCTSSYSPYYYFPLLTAESSAAGAAGWLAQVSALAEYFVKAAYVDPAAALPEVLDALAVNGVTLVGRVDTPSPERFVALLGMDALPGLQQLLPQVLSGTGGVTVETQVKIVQIMDNTVITPGKTTLFDQVAADLAAGIIIPLSVQ